jgi:hypothetical protein
MVSVIRAIVLSAIAQVVLLAALIGYLFVHTDGTAQAYALLAEQNAAHYTDEVAKGLKDYADEGLRNQYNDLQIQFSGERADMQNFVDRRIDLKLSTFLNENRQ